MSKTMTAVAIAVLLALIGVPAQAQVGSCSLLSYCPPATGGPGGGAPTDAQYVTAAAHGDLSAERVCTDTATIDCDAGTAAQMKFNWLGGTFTTPTLGPTGCAAPGHSFSGDNNAGMCLSAANSLVVGPNTNGSASSGFFSADTTLAAITYFNAASAPTALQCRDGDCAFTATGGATYGSFTTTGLLIGAVGAHDRISITPAALGAGSFTGTFASADLTAARTWAMPDANASLVQAITCGGTDKVSAISSLGVPTCSADTSGGADNTTTDDNVNVGNGATSDSKALENGFVRYDTSTNTFSAGLTVGTGAPGGTACDVVGEVGTLYRQSGDPASVNLQFFGCTQTGAATFGWKPVGHYAGTDCPATCTAAAGGLCYDTDDDLLKSCTADNTWTTITGGSFSSPGLGFVVDTVGDGTLAARSATSGDGSVVIANPAGTAGNPDFTVDSAVFARFSSGVADASGACAPGTFHIRTDTDKAWFCTDNTPTWTGVATGGGTATGANTADVTLAGTPDYITISGQQITRGQVDLAADVTGDLPYANVVQASAASKLVGRGSAAGAGDLQEVTLGTNLSMSGTTLNASGGSSSLVIFGGSGSLTRINASTTEYMVPWGGIEAPSSTESFRRVRFPSTCTLGNLYVNLITAQPASGSLVLTLRVNDSDTAVTITIAADGAAGIYSDVTHTAAVTAGQWAVLKGVNNATAESGFMNSWTMTCS